MTSRPGSSPRPPILPRSMLIAACVTGALLHTVVRSVSAGQFPTVYIRVPGLGRADWSEGDGGHGRRFFDRCSSEGRISSEGEIAPDAREWLDRWNAALAPDSSEGTLLWLDDSALEELDRFIGEPATGFALRYGAPRLGSSSVRVRPTGGSALDRTSSLLAESRAWLPAVPTLRWEEAIEMLEIGSRENEAFRRLRATAGPSGALVRLRDAFSRDKGTSNLGLWILGTRRPLAVGWSLGLVTAHTDCARSLQAAVPQPAPLRAEPFTPDPDRALSFDQLSPDSQDAARRRFFAARVGASVGRVVARVDRILQSIAAVAPPGLTLVVDARGPDDGFVAVWSKDVSVPDAWWRSLPEPQRMRTMRASASLRPETARAK